MQRLHRLFDRRMIVPAMDLIEIDVIGAETAQARINLGHDGLARNAHAVWTGTHAEIDFGGDRHLLASCELFKRSPDDFFAGATRVHVCRIEEIDAAFDGTLDERPAFLLAQGPQLIAAIGRAIAHAAEAY